MSILAKIYSAVVRKRNKKFDLRKSSIYTCDIPVISVGNLSAGGTGKTPFTIMLCDMIKELGFKPGVISRGYKRLSKGEVIVSDGNAVLVDSAAGGDEAVMLANKTQVPVIVNEDKSLAAKAMAEKFDVDCILVDDGFQHRKLFRDLDIVILDEYTLKSPKLLPDGRLREPLSSLSRADIVCLKGNTPLTDDAKEHISSSAQIIRIKAYYNKPYNLFSKKTLIRKEFSTMKQGVITLCGIAKPQNFLNLLNRMKINVINEFNFKDHHKYSSRDIENILHYCKSKNVNYIASTEKDAVKLIEFASLFEKYKINCNIFPIYLLIKSGKSEFIHLLRSILSKGVINDDF